MHIILWIFIIIVVLITIGCFLAKQDEKKEEEQFNHILQEKGITLGDDSMYEIFPQIESNPIKQLVVNRMNGSKCIGKEWYYFENFQWNFYVSEDVDCIWQYWLERRDLTYEDGEKYIKINHTSKNDIVKQWFYPKEF